jgi:hypothetical protein
LFAHDSEVFGVFIRVIVGDDSRVAARYKRYLSGLEASGLTNMIFEAGFGVIQKAVQWNRYEQANDLLNTWIEFLCRTLDFEPLMHLVAREISSGNLWSSFKLLDRLGEKKCPSLALRFQGVALQCVILEALTEQSRSQEQIKGIEARAQLDWVAHETSSNNLEALLYERVTEACARLSELKDLSPFEKTLKERVDLIAKSRGDSLRGLRSK